MKRAWFRRLGRLTAFCLAAALLLVYASLVLMEKNSTVWGIYAEPKNSLDVLYVGGSHTNAAVSPLQIYEQQGFTGYVLYSWSQPVWTSYHYVKEALKTQRPKVVVLDTFGFVYGNTYITDVDINTVSDQYSLKIKPSLNKLRLAIAMSRCQTGHKPFYRYADLMQYHGRWKNLTLGDFTWAFLPHPDMGKGFGPIYTTESFQHNQPGTITEQKGYAAAEAYLYKFMELAQNEGFQLVLMDLPYIAGDMEYGIYARLQRICAENGVDYISYLADSTLGQVGFAYETDMAEHAHVNYKGAAKLTEHLGRYLAGRYALPDHRQDPAYESWNVLAAAEKRELQDGDLKMTFDLGELLTKAMADDYLLVLQTRGDLTKADGAAVQAAFAAHGLPAEIFTSSSANALYVYAGGERIYGEVGQGRQLACTYTGSGYTLAAQSSPDAALCQLNGEELGRNRPGLNIVVLDFATGKRVQSVSFSTEHDYTAFTA